MLIVFTIWITGTALTYRRLRIDQQRAVGRPARIAEVVAAFTWPIFSVYKFMRQTAQ